MKKLLALILTLALSLCLFGCGDKDKKEDPNENPGGDVTVNPDGSVDLPIIDVDWD